MLERPIEQLTLREKFTDAERLTRELIEHLDQGFIPKAAALGRTARTGLEENPLEPIRDLTVRTRAAELLESENFTNQLFEKASGYFEAIDLGIAQIRDGI